MAFSDQALSKRPKSDFLAPKRKAEEKSEDQPAKKKAKKPPAELGFDMMWRPRKGKKEGKE